MSRLIGRMSATRHNGYVGVTNDMDFRRMLAHTAANPPSVVSLRVAPLTPGARGDGLQRNRQHNLKKQFACSDVAVGLFAIVGFKPLVDLQVGWGYPPLTQRRKERRNQAHLNIGSISIELALPFKTVQIVAIL